MCSRAVGLGVVVVSALSWSPASAQDSVLDEARASYEAADLEGALSLLDRAEQGDALTPEDLPRLLELRILIDLALGDTQATQREIARLATVAPGHVFAPEISPDIQQRLIAEAAAREGPLGLSLLHIPSASGGRSITAIVRNDPARVVQEVRLFVRHTADGPWQRSGGELELPGPSPHGFVYAEAVGPGGVVVARDGSADAPVEIGQPRAAPLQDEQPEPRADRDRDDRTLAASGDGIPWAWLAAGVGAVAVLTVVAVLVANGGSGSGQPDVPAFEDW